jgi:glutathione synthase/RimK-type ligase-like ATP-grasp enzyme
VKRHALILSALRHDIHASAVRWGLRQGGLDARWVLSPAEEGLAPASLHTDGRSEWRASGWLDATEVSCVWFRRAHNPEAFPRASAGDAAFLRTEWARFLRNAQALTDELSDRLWVNRPSSALAAENKLVQLQAARRAGLRFPPTLVSHDPAAIRRFAESHGRVVYKPFMPHTWKDAASGRMFSTFARVLEPGMLDDDASLSICPGIYQAYVDKECDLRVVAIGSRLFAVRLRSSAGEAFVDWRAHTYAPELRAEVVALPAAHADGLRALLAGLGLAFGCIDVAIERGGEPYFLEVNQAGQFLFLEDMVAGAGAALPLLRAMCALLAEGRIDYSLDAAADVTYAGYLASDVHAEWREEVRGDIEAASREGAWLTVE